MADKTTRKPKTSSRPAETSRPQYRSVLLSGWRDLAAQDRLCNEMADEGYDLVETVILSGNETVMRYRLST